MKGASAFLAAAAASTALAVPPVRSPIPYSLRGVQLGVTLDAFRAFPIPEDADRHPNKRVQCDDSAMPIRCMWVGDELPNSVGNRVYTQIGGADQPIDFLFTQAADGKLRLMRMEVIINMSSMTKILDPLTTKYGPPKTKASTVQNGFGANFEKITSTWSNGVSSIVTESRCGEIDFFCVTYSHLPLEARNASIERASKPDPTSKL